MNELVKTVENLESIINGQKNEIKNNRKEIKRKNKEINFLKNELADTLIIIIIQN